MSRRAALGAMLLAVTSLVTGCAHRCSTVAVIPNEYVVLHCPGSGAPNGIVVILWRELVGPWPVAP